MTKVINSNSGLPGASINLSTNLISIGLGEKVLVDAGIVNSVIIGGWNRLLAGTSTIIQLGTKMDALFANQINIVWGNSWQYMNTNQIVREVELRWAHDELSISTGMNNYTFEQNNNTQLKIIFTILALYAFTLGISLLATIIPPFKPSDNNSNVKVNSGNEYIIVLESTSILFIFIIQFFMAKEMSTGYTSNLLQANISLSAKGLNATFFSDQEIEPRFVQTNNSQSHTHSGHHILRGSGYSLFGMLPGMPQQQNNLTNLKNPVSEIYSTHDNAPVITLYSRNTIVNNNAALPLQSSLIDILPSSILIGTNKVDIPSQYISRINLTGADIEELENIYSSCVTSHNANICLNPTYKSIGIQSYDNMNGSVGMISLEQPKTSLLKHRGQGIAIIFETQKNENEFFGNISPIIPRKSLNIIPINPDSSFDNQLSNSDDEFFEEPLYPTENLLDLSLLDNSNKNTEKSNTCSSLSGVYLLNKNACLMTNNLLSGIFISADTDQHSIMFKNQAQASAIFSNEQIQIGNSNITKSKTELGDNLSIKAEENELPSSFTDEFSSDQPFAITHTNGIQGLEKLKMLIEQNNDRIKRSGEHISAIQGTIVHDI